MVVRALAASILRLVGNRKSTRAEDDCSYKEKEKRNDRVSFLPSVVNSITSLYHDIMIYAVGLSFGT